MTPIEQWEADEPTNLTYRIAKAVMCARWWLAGKVFQVAIWINGDEHF